MTVFRNIYGERFGIMATYCMRISFSGSSLLFRSSCYYAQGVMLLDYIAHAHFSIYCI